MTIDVAPLQARLGIATDGILGPNTYRALFARAGASPTMAGELAIGANAHFAAFGLLDNGLRLAHFMAQVAHESGGFRFMSEIWGPTPAQSGYEGRADLGNKVPGDGYRYRGRGPLELTGRLNYHRFGALAGIDFESHPELVEIPSVGLHVACLFWADRAINVPADADDVNAVTHKVNGGLNGLSDRVARLLKMKSLIL
jgi:putative chitinase